MSLKLANAIHLKWNTGTLSPSILVSMWSVVRELTRVEYQVKGTWVSFFVRPLYVRHSQVQYIYPFFQVALIGPNHLDSIVVTWAVLRLGGIILSV